MAPPGSTEALPMGHPKKENSDSCLIQAIEAPATAGAREDRVPDALDVALQNQVPLLYLDKLVQRYRLH